MSSLIFLIIDICPEPAAIPLLPFKMIGFKREKFILSTYIFHFSNTSQYNKTIHSTYLTAVRIHLGPNQTHNHSLLPQPPLCPCTPPSPTRYSHTISRPLAKIKCSFCSLSRDRLRTGHCPVLLSQNISRGTAPSSLLESRARMNWESHYFPGRPPISLSFSQNNPLPFLSTTLYRHAHPVL